ncbi:sensor histidine kinase [Aquimarina sp. 2201CG5-10]|uniref:sensor histidine kinase n=1 Tax=Aquimarina callyspongiae TaxID=3098150 RepID=UPI002AB4069C|nr:ATP-binding protein [Aquimarina sp. 2201CG5-10]MDY8138128.1 histidine kinase [Aquimarina sp. 2201CG5-10]
MQEWQKPETITLWIVIIVSFLLLLLTFIIVLVRAFFQKIAKTQIAEAKTKLEYQQNLLENTIKTQEKERERIAKDLHDALIGKLTVLKMQQEINQENQEFTSLIQESITVARNISHDLSPPLLEYTPLDDLIKDLLDPWKKNIPIDDRYDIRGNDSHTNDLKIQLTRIIQELLTNITKHANATIINLHLRSTNSTISLFVEDNGKGFIVENKHKGLGLTNIETRVQYLKGHYRLKSKVNQGTSFLFLFKNNML